MSLHSLPDGQLIDVHTFAVSNGILMAYGHLGDGREFACESEHIFPPQDRGPFKDRERLMMLEKQAD